MKHLPLKFTFILCFFCSNLSLALSPDEKDPKKIMQAVEDREKGNNFTGTMTMIIKDDKNRKRKRQVKLWGKEFAKDKKMLMLFESPGDVRNTGLLSYDYDQKDKDDDQWLYLPSLKKTTRISGGDKSGSFMGSDLSYKDMSSKPPENYNYKIKKQSVKVGKEDCWLIEARAKTAKEKEETGYLKTNVWVSKSKLMVLKVKAWVKEGKKLKYIKMGDIKKIDGIWIPHKLSVKTIRNKKTLSSTLILYNDYKLNQKEVNEDIFSHRRLEKGL